MQGIKDCKNCLHIDAPKHDGPCRVCVENRYIRGPGMPVSFTEWTEDTRVPAQENKINAEDFMRALGCDRCKLYPNSCPHDDYPEATPCPDYKDQVVVETQGTGMKYDSGKTRLGILLREFSGTLCGIGEVLSFGANKYVEGSWMNVPDAQRRYEDAFLRHLLAIKNGEWLDQESGLPHIDHALTNLMFMRHFYMEDKQ